MTERNIFAHTQNDPVDGYVPYVSLNRVTNGVYSLTVRGTGDKTSTITLTEDVLGDLAGKLVVEVGPQQVLNTLLDCAVSAGKSIDEQLSRITSMLAEMKR